MRFSFNVSRTRRASGPTVNREDGFIAHKFCWVKPLRCRIRLKVDAAQRLAENALANEYAVRLFWKHFFITI
jgi:hypothetical protein